MSKAPLVTAIVPAFNAARWIDTALRSLLAQSWPRVEVVVVDDGSRDGTIDVARRFESERVRVVAQPNAGASAARNRGLALAQGDYIQYLDADDCLHPRKIERQIERLGAESPGHVASAAWARFAGDPSTAQPTPEPVWADLDPVAWLVTAWLGGGMMPNSAWLVPREVSEKTGHWDESITLNDDGEYFTRVVLASSGVTFCGDAVTYYRSGIPGSLSGRRAPAAIEGYFRSLVDGIELLRAREDSPRVRSAGAAQLQRFVYTVYPDAMPLVRRAESLIAALGGSPLPPPDGGPAFRAVRRLLGWRAARRLQMAARTLSR